MSFKLTKRQTKAYDMAINGYKKVIVFGGAIRWLPLAEMWGGKINEVVRPTGYCLHYHHYVYFIPSQDG